MIEVEKKNAGEFLVIVDEENSKTEHNVELDDEYYQNSFYWKESQKNRFFQDSI